MTAEPRTDSLVGLGRLVTLTLRRDRIRLLIWVVALVGVVLVSAGALPPIYSDRAAQEQYVALASGNPALEAFGGPGSGFDDPNIGVILVNEVQLWSGIGVALMAVFLLTRHTRAEEDDDRADVIRSGVVGRHAPLIAAALVVSGAIVAVSAACAIGFVVLGYAFVGSVSLAVSIAAIGLVFVGVSAVAAQVASSARATLGSSVAALGAMFVLRAIGDAGRGWVRWLSPLGWAQSGRAFAGERWWPLGLCVVLAIVLIVVAQVLMNHRDLGSGLIASRGGPARASRWLTTPLGLVVRLERGAIAAWILGLLIFGALYGSIGDQIGKFIADNPVYADLVAQVKGTNLTDAFFASAMAMLALFSSGFAISSTLRLRAEENAGRADTMLAGPLSRTRWAASHLVVAVVGSTVIVAAGGLGAGIAYALVAGEPSEVTRMVGASLVTVPGVLVLTGFTMALFGLAPRASLAAWAALAAVSVIAFFGELLRLPQWVRDLSPFTHLPALPAQDLRWAPVLATLALAAALMAVGLWGFGRRDVAAA